MAPQQDSKTREVRSSGTSDSKVKRVPAFPTSDEERKMLGVCDLWLPRHKTHDSGRERYSFVCKICLKIRKWRESVSSRKDKKEAHNYANPDKKSSLSRIHNGVSAHS